MFYCTEREYIGRCLQVLLSSYLAPPQADKTTAKKVGIFQFIPPMSPTVRIAQPLLNRFNQLYLQGDRLPSPHRSSSRPLFLRKF
jgi:hypothetical protein